MCGIVGYFGTQQAQEILLDCLGRLEYRGYDSAGMAVITDGKLQTLRSPGKSASLQKRLNDFPLPGHLGIAHTRWATHGKPTESNSHPHSDCNGTLALVHNGIVANYRELRQKLEDDGHHFLSETDSEVIAHLIEEQLTRSPAEGIRSAVVKVLPMLQGAYALAVIGQAEPDKIVVARNGGPAMVIGHGEHGVFISSDITAISHYTTNIQIVENGEVAVITQEGARITLLNDEEITREKIAVTPECNAPDRSSYQHYMLKEIHEQPAAVLRTLQAHWPEGKSIMKDTGYRFDRADFSGPGKRITLLACGSSWHAALVGKYLIESVSGIPVDVDIASEYRYRKQVGSSHGLVIGISQSGETADTLGALQEARRRGARTVGICNVAGSSMSRECDSIILTHAGFEIGVAATKTYTCQLTALLLLSVSLGMENGCLSPRDAEAIYQNLSKLPLLMETVLGQEKQLAEISVLLDQCSSALFLGRGVMFPTALEGALKLKEISYIHAEAYPAGELKHGPIALIGKGLPVVVIATSGPLYEKVLSAIQEVSARDGMVIVIATEGDSRILGIADHVFFVPDVADLLLPILMAVPLQLLAYHAANRRGHDVDKPRNLAKSVTVD